MQKLKYSLFLLTTIILSFSLTGCVLSSSFWPTSSDNESDIVETIKTNAPVLAVVVGMEVSEFAGKCEGSEFDSIRVKNLMDLNKIPTIYLKNDNATRNRVKTALSQIIKNSDETAIFYYSGHGGFKTNKPSEIDPEPNDQFLCCYDGPVYDDEIWKIISQSKSKVVCIFDCCHSETMYRAPTFEKYIGFGDMTTTNFNDCVAQGGVLVISGCPDEKYSYGSPKIGGYLTHTLFEGLDVIQNPTYEDICVYIDENEWLRMFQTPMITIINGFDTQIPFLK